MRVSFVILLTLLLVGVTPSRAQSDAIPASFFGMTAIRANDYPNVDFGMLGHPGVGVWPQIERQKGVYDFTFTDNFVKAAVAHGLVDSTNTVSMAITLGYTPQWYASDPKSCTVNTNSDVTLCTSGPTDVQPWANYVAALVNHYNGVTMPHIRYYELWNEANTKTFYNGTYTELVNLAKAAYPIIHIDNYSILLTPSVVGPTNTPRPWPPFITDNRVNWMATYLDAGGAQYADGGAFHGYIGQESSSVYPMPEQDSTPQCTGVKASACYGSIITEVLAIRDIFDKHGLAGKPIFDTEGSWGKGSITDPDTQSAWLARWYILQAGLRSEANLQMVTWFAWDGTVFNWGSIETPDGKPTQAGMAYNVVNHWLVGATINRHCIDILNVWKCELTRPGGYSALVIWTMQGTGSYTVPAGAYADYRDLAGNTTPIEQGTPIWIGVKPILLESSRLN